MKKQKGITLIALVITIIVMLILVGVSVTVALNGGLFSTAKQATSGTQLELDKEQLLSAVIGAINNKGKVDFDVLDNNLPEGFTKTGERTYTSKSGNTFTVSENAAITLVGQTEGGSGETGGDTGEDVAGSWQQEGNEIKYVTASGEVTTTLSVGTKVTYDETDGTPLAYETDATKGTGTSYTSGALVAGKYTIAGTGEGETAAGDLEWRVLGVNEEGQVELISTTPTTSTLYLYGKAGYENAETVNGVLGTLDTFCNNIYGQGEGAVSARSLTAEDINKLGNYDPTTYSTYGKKYTYKYYAEYGRVYGIASASITDENRDTITGWTATSKSFLHSPDWTISSNNVGPYEYESTYYSYTVSNQITMTDPVDMATLITKGEGGTSNVRQWLASSVVDCTAGYIDVDLRTLYDGTVKQSSLFSLSGGTTNAYGYAVRPVVTLETRVQLSDTDSDGIFELN